LPERGLIPIESIVSSGGAKKIAKRGYRLDSVFTMEELENA
jgi:hypothetical protein